MKMLKFTVFIAFFSLFFPVITSASFDISAKSAIVIDSLSNEVLFEKDAYTKRGMASTTKIMTALLAIENLDKTEEVIVSPFAASTEGSSIWLAAGEKICVEDLLYGLMLSSGNDAATALAEHMSGSVDAFTVLMNKKAREIGCNYTNFQNPHGLPNENHYTTCFDLALISAAAMRNETFREIVGTKNRQISWEGSEWNRSLSNHNKLLKKRDYFTGIKTGYTKKDGRCLVSSAKQDGREIIIVTLSAPDDWNDHIKLAEYCFSVFSPVEIIKQGDSAGIKTDPSYRFDDIHMIYSDTLVLSLKNKDFSNISKQIEFSPEFPVKKGDKVAECKIFYDEKLIYEIDITAENNSLYKNDFFTIFKELMKGLINK